NKAQDGRQESGNGIHDAGIAEKADRYKHGDEERDNPRRGIEGFTRAIDKLFVHPDATKCGVEREKGKEERDGEECKDKKNAKDRTLLRNVGWRLDECEIDE